MSKNFGDHTISGGFGSAVLYYKCTRTNKDGIHS